MMKFNTFIATSLLAVCGAYQASASVSDICKIELDAYDFVVVVPHNAGGGRDRAARFIISTLQDDIDLNVRIENIPDMNGQIALRNVAKGVQENTIWLGFYSILNIATGLAMYQDAPNFRAYQPIMQFDLEYKAFGGTEKFDFFSNDPQDLIVAPLGAFAMSELLGTFPTLNVTNIMGYSGASETLTAALRGDVDQAIFAAEYVDRQNKGNPDFIPTLFMGPTDKNPWDNVPYFTGPGGVAEHLISSAQADQLDVLTKHAELIATLAQDSSGFFAAASLPETVSGCIKDLFNNLDGDVSVIDQAAELGLSFSPLSSYDYEKFYDNFSTIMEENSIIMREMFNK